MKKVTKLTPKNVGNFVRILRSSDDEKDRLKPELYRVVQCQVGEPNPCVILENLMSGEQVMSPTILTDGKPFFFYAILARDEAFKYLHECCTQAQICERYLLAQANERSQTAHACIMASAPLAR